MNTILVYVKIERNENGTYTWAYQSDSGTVHPETGAIHLDCLGETQIVFIGQNPDFQLIYVNLDPWICATRQISTVAININPVDGFPANSIVLTDLNGSAGGVTQTTPFSVRLVARALDDLGTPIISPDPEVENDPVGNLMP